MIDPGTNPKGETVEAYCRRRWGGAGWTKSLISEGKKDGAKFEDWKWWPHTLKAHQLIQYCASQGISTDKVNQLLFRTEYENGENISQVGTLVAIGQEAGVADTEELTSYLEKDKGEAKVKEEIAVGRQRYRISGVPFFVIGSDSTARPYGFSGAQKSETFVELFEELSDE
mmetsp:Transcript_108795/g.162727  ORF Transcript_108795/g.162727 Transcript_108795/m.162727 type:complete len:171 (-) Transcript_108795:22-534(-)|eukprot:CAMPEP_0116997306 /NCGR_PEP_ID=MMETSP0472-20121206/788_1 /TAXON_ID=693140 ORGANISM="Tiarina fusus, Strain LIS" /NCGR_SAMPLE_ID=MMETSP0472 /ASSEMBLY_ACC=CAM_ASM_000603 /LENGTH=170 /DNA_ID=CAMNT_0004696147 /DNA_START=195 /DNA_END=707 /DNA_ORIENTATION=-